MHEPGIAVEPGPLIPNPLPSDRLTMRSLFAVTVAVAMYVGFVVPKREFHACLGETKSDVAKLVVTQYVNEAFPAWLQDHRGPCRVTLRELAAYMDRPTTRDPWGRNYVLTCGDNKVYVMSLGEDGVSNTADDIWSHQ